MRNVVKEDVAFAMLRGWLFSTGTKLTDVILTIYANAEFKMIKAGRASA